LFRPKQGNPNAPQDAFGRALEEILEEAAPTPIYETYVCMAAVAKDPHIWARGIWLDVFSPMDDSDPLAIYNLAMQGEERSLGCNVECLSYIEIPLRVSCEKIRV
jgi:hypothetical protein